MDVGNFVIDRLKKGDYFCTNAYVMRTWFCPMVIRFLFKYLVALFHPNTSARYLIDYGTKPPYP